MGHKFVPYSDFNLNFPGDGEYSYNTDITQCHKEGDRLLSTHDIYPARYRRDYNKKKQVVYINCGNASRVDMPRSWTPDAWWVPICGWRAMDRVIEDILAITDENKIPGFDRVTQIWFRNWGGYHDIDYIDAQFAADHPKRIMAQESNALGPLLPLTYPSDSVYAGHQWGSYPSLGDNNYFIDTWHEFREYWENREGITFGLYIGSWHHMNRGSYEEPNYYFVRTPDDDHPEAGNTVTLPDGTDFDVPADAKDDSFALLKEQVRFAHSLGFKLMGIDVKSRILTQADDADGSGDFGTYRAFAGAVLAEKEDRSGLMPRTPGIMNDLDECFYEDAEIRGWFESGEFTVAMETMVAWGRYHANFSQIFITNHEDDPSTSRNVRTEMRPAAIQSIMNPGVNFYSWGSGSNANWAIAEQIEWQQECRDKGIVPCFQWNTQLVDTVPEDGDGEPEQLNTIQTFSVNDQPAGVDIINANYYSKGGPTIP